MNATDKPPAYIDGKRNPAYTAWYERQPHRVTAKQAARKTVKTKNARIRREPLSVGVSTCRECRQTFDFATVAARYWPTFGPTWCLCDLCQD